MLRLFVGNTLNFHYDVGCQGIEIYPCIKFCLLQCFPLSVTCTYICCVGRDRFSKKYSVYNILTMTVFVVSQSFISLQSFMFVSAVVSEIHDLNQNKKKKKENYVENTLSRHITDPPFNF